MNKNKVLVPLFMLAILLQSINSQNNTNSLYTRYGYGDVTDAYSGNQRGMGGAALGSRDRFSINTVNPASYSSVDSLTFMFDIGASALSTRITTPSVTKKAFNANLNYIAMQFPLSKGMGFSAGLLPYSFVGYNFYTTTNEIKNGENLTSTQSFSGDGGFNQVYMGLSKKLFNHFSLGINAYYMFGSVNNYRSVSFDSLSSSTPSTIASTIKANNFRFRLGAQYFNTFSDKHDLTVGVIFEKKMKLNGNLTERIVEVISDTINAKSNSGYELPTVYGLGFSYTYAGKLTLGVDYSMQEWSKTKFAGKTDSLLNSSRIAAGIQFIPNPRGRRMSDHINYRAGFNVSDSYIKTASGKSDKNYGISLGLGLPVYDKQSNSMSMLNLSFEYGKIGGTSQLREDYFKMTVSMSFREHWFMKRKL